MNWSDIKGLIGSAAPMIGTVIGGPAGAAIGAMVASGLGVENTPKAVSDALKNDPYAFIKLKQIEADNEAGLREYTFKTLDAELKDVQNARAENKHSKMPAVITCVMTAIAIAYGVALFFVVVPPTNRDLINYFGGQLVTLWVASVVYWIGTTRSSAEKSKGQAR